MVSSSLQFYISSSALLSLLAASESLEITGIEGTGPVQRLFFFFSLDFSNIEVLIREIQDGTLVAWHKLIDGEDVMVTTSRGNRGVRGLNI